jgi:hypothetical protein
MSLIFTGQTEILPLIKCVKKYLHSTLHSKVPVHTFVSIEGANPVC